MLQGFYNLTSGMLTQSRKLNVISNNMSNISTTGYKYDTFTATTFQDEMIYRTGNMDKSNPTPIGNMSMIVTGDGNVTNHKQGTVTTTASTLDFALGGRGFFAVQSPDGVVYTRSGSFVLDQEGYLYLDGVGRVLGQNGPIQLGTDKINADSAGNIYNKATGQQVGRLQIVDFQNYGTDLRKTTGGVYTATGAPQASNAQVMWKTVEDSNVDAVQEMTNMMGSQRALQSAAQVLKMYDQLTGKIVQIGPA